ncbi:hypothetical protein ACJMK2_013023 [Sinanodonta woodiana]|uniref:Uncharacterized protein n=1 Tax=Sinanodonta woodiana TaxID=1069815 RepID=A0ABD3VA24_SINWO
MMLFLVLLGILYTVPCHGDSTGECSEVNRTSNLSACLRTMMTKAQSINEFWFGTEYSQRCPAGPPANMSPECFNSNARVNDSLASRMFLSTFNPALVDRYLDVVFQVQGGQYSACGNTYVMNGINNVAVDPLTTQPLTPWDVKMMPSIKWNSTPGEYYMLFIYDVGYYITHGIYINIQNNDIKNAEAIKSYRGALITTNIKNPYAFLLFKQNGTLNLTEEWRNKFNSSVPENFTISQMVLALSLTGPVALNWFVATGDPYAIQQMLTMRIMNLCPRLVTTAARNRNESFIPITTNLVVSVDVTFHPPPLTFQSCCTDYTYPHREVKLNPIGNGLIKAGEVRTGLTLYVTMVKEGVWGNADLENVSDKLYTLLCIDPDVPISSVGTKDNPLIHMMTININGSVANGNTLVPYRGPMPPNDVPHAYYFLLYEQRMEMNTTTPSRYSPSTCSPPGRCLFNIRGFAADNNLTLVGASWMLSEKDEYVRYLLIQSGRNETEMCGGVKGYAYPCPVAKAHLFGPCGYYVYISCIIIYLLLSL